MRRQWLQPGNRKLTIALLVVTSTILILVEPRPHNAIHANITVHKSPTLNSSQLYTSLARNDTLGSSSSQSFSSAERTRILSFPRRPQSNEDNYHPDIVFPDSLESFSSSSSHVSFEPATMPLDVAPECATGSSTTTFCEEVTTYPYKLLREVLNGGKGKAADSALFGADEVPDEIAQRIGEPEENYICSAVDKTVFPKAGKNKNNKWKFIINQGTKDGYVQGVRVELCVQTGKPCDLFGNQPNGYVTSCKQKYIYRKMMSLSDGGQPIPDTFLMPSACCCAYKRDNRFLARFGEPGVTPIK